MKYLDQALYEYSESDVYPFHMPGHKRQVMNEYMKNPYEIDITEITDFDNLHHAEGIIKENQKIAADLYHAQESWFLINGSTAGILAAISACTTRCGHLLMARNCHKAVYHGAYLRGLKTTYLYPSYESLCGLNGGIAPEDVEKALKKERDVEAVIITSPSYDGVVSDIENIARIVHSYKIPLIVDEAHGAHFTFHSGFPVSALDLGADVVIQSLHKTLPAMTQTAILHKNGKIVSSKKIEEFLDIYETSSPSYVLMGGISYCLRFLIEEGNERFNHYWTNLMDARKKLQNLQRLRLVGEELKERKYIFDFDLSKIIITTANTSIHGPKLHEILRKKYHLEMEMEAEEYILAITSVMDTKDGLDRLVTALLEIDKTLPLGERIHENYSFVDSNLVARNRQRCCIFEAVEGKWEEVSWEESLGRISAEYAYLYPPGIPLLVPGEEISRDFLEHRSHFMEQGMKLQGLHDFQQKFIRVLL